jgi:hypothetical protein
MKLSLFAIQFENLYWSNLFTNALYNINSEDTLVHKNFDDIFLTDIVNKGQDSFRFCQLKTGLKSGLSVKTLCFILTNLEIKPIVKVAN